MLTVGEWIDKVHEITDALENKASIKKSKELEKVNAYYEGYTQACEDFGRAMRQAISEEQGQKGELNDTRRYRNANLIRTIVPGGI